MPVARLVALTLSIVALGCHPRSGPVTPSAPADGADFVAASTEPASETAPARAWRDSLGNAGWKPFAKRLRLDARKLARAMESPMIEQKIAEDEAAAKAFAVNGTPTFFVNGRILVGAQPIEGFETLVVEELAKAREFTANDPGGPGTVYDRMIEGFAPPVR